MEQPSTTVLFPGIKRSQDFSQNEVNINVLSRSGSSWLVHPWMVMRHASSQICCWRSGIFTSWSTFQPAVNGVTASTLHFALALCEQKFWARLSRYCIQSQVTRDASQICKISNYSYRHFRHIWLSQTEYGITFYHLLVYISCSAFDCS